MVSAAKVKRLKAQEHRGTVSTGKGGRGEAQDKTIEGDFQAATKSSNPNAFTNNAQKIRWDEATVEGMGSLSASEAEKIFKAREKGSQPMEQEPKKKSFLGKVGEGLNKVDTLGGLITPEQQALGESQGLLGNIGAGLSPASTGAAVSGVVKSLRPAKIGTQTIAKAVPQVQKDATLGNLMSRFKIDARQADKVQKLIEKQTIADITKQFFFKPKTLGGKAKSLFFNPKLQLPAGLALWYASDNMQFMTSSRSRKALTDYQFGTISQSEALEDIDDSLALAKTARAGTISAASINPYVYPFAYLFIKGAKTNVENIERDREMLIGI